VYLPKANFELIPSVNRQNNSLLLKTKKAKALSIRFMIKMSSERIHSTYFFESTVNENNHHKRELKKTELSLGQSQSSLGVKRTKSPKLKI